MRRLRGEGALVLATALALPWVYGGVELWAYRAASLLLAVAAAIALGRDGWRGLRLDRGAAWLAPAGILALWAALQLVPLPPAVLQAVAPETAAEIRAGIPGWPDEGRDAVVALFEDARKAAPEAPGAAEGESLVGGSIPRPSRWRALSLHPAATAERLAWYVALLLAFLVVRSRTSRPQSTHAFRVGLLALAATLAAFGLGQALLTPGQLYGRVIEGTRPFGPYVNPSHFCGVMELLVPWSAAYAWSRFRIGGRARGPALAATVVGVLGLAAAIASASRAGTGLLIVALFVLAVYASRGRRLLAATVTVLLLGAVLAAALLWGTLGTRVRDSILSGEEDLSFVARWVVLHSLGEMVGDHPVFGIGFGAFRVVFPRYLPSGEAELWNQAHDDWGEVAAEGGLVALGCVLWLAAGFWRRAWATVRETSDRGFGLARFGLLLGLGTLTLHAFVDFNHQIPANALLFVVASAVALSPGQEQEATRP